MKRFFSGMALVCLLSVSGLAGEIPVPPGPPPDCQENCTQSTTVVPISPVPVWVIEILLTIIRP